MTAAALRRHEAGPGVIGPGCTPGEGTGCTKMVTPHLDALASESTLFMKNYVQQAVCSPTRTSLLTGRRPDTTQVWDLYTSALPYPEGFRPPSPLPRPTAPGADSRHVQLLP